MISRVVQVDACADPGLRRDDGVGKYDALPGRGRFCGDRGPAVGSGYAFGCRLACPE